MTILKKENMNMVDFWSLPLFIALEYLDVFLPVEKKPISRKRLIVKEREFNRRRGIV
jgi:hypothetical protein